VRTLALALALIVAPTIVHGAPPSVVRTVKAEYPPWAVGAGLGTKVRLRVLVGTDGRPRRIVVLPYTTRDDILTRSMRASFDSAAVRAAWRWTFLPGTRGGRQVASWLVVHVPFADPKDAPDTARGARP
jgi:TonB family protein